MKHAIFLSEAVDMTNRYRNNPVDGLFLSETFEKASVAALLNQSGSAFFRIYLGRKEDDSIHCILVAADEEGKDILPPQNETSGKNPHEEGIILEDAFHCPPVCPPPSPLNE